MIKGLTLVLIQAYSAVIFKSVLFLNELIKRQKKQTTKLILKNFHYKTEEEIRCLFDDILMIILLIST